MYIDVLHRLTVAVRRKHHEKWRISSLFSSSRQCSSTSVGFGQGFLSEQHCDNTGASSILSRPAYVFPWLKSALKGRRFYDAPDVIMNRKEELKSLHKMASTNVSITCTATVRSVWLHEGTILKDMWLKRFTVLYFPDVMWFWEHSEATMYNRILEPRMITEYLTDERQSTTICISVYKCNKRTGHKAFKAAAADDHDDEGDNDDSENNDKYLVISTIHEAFQNEFFSILLLLHSS